MRIVEYKSVGLVNLGILRSELINLLGIPESEKKSRIWAVELNYPSGIYRFDLDDRLKEISADLPEFEINGGSVLFKNLGSFLKQHDKDAFERAGFLISPRFGLAFDQYFPSWLTVISHGDLELWHSIESKK